MQISDDGYIINLLRHGENSLIVTVLSVSHGKMTGYVKGGVSKKKLGFFQLGNAISFNAYARVEENLPQFRGVELLKAHAVNFMVDEQKLAVLRSFCELMTVCTVEKESLEYLIFYIQDFMDSVNTPQWLVKYSFVEYYLLEFLGIGLDLSVCAVTGKKKELAYVSPKSGKAVSLEVGLPYAHKLFQFPQYIVDKNYGPEMWEVAELLRMTQHFLQKNFFQIHGLKFPINRGNLLNNLKLLKENE